MRVREALAAELEEAAATADKAVRRREHRKRQRQVCSADPAHFGRACAICSRCFHFRCRPVSLVPSRLVLPTHKRYVPEFARP